jgi:hypothetical protein
MFNLFKKSKPEKQSSLNMELEKLKQENRKTQERLEKTVLRNNSGIDLEKDEKIDEAIKIYKRK